jgi:shikimate kinase
LLGQKASGKTTVGLAMAERTNMKLVDFEQFILENGLIG